MAVRLGLQKFTIFAYHNFRFKGLVHERRVASTARFFILYICSMAKRCSTPGCGQNALTLMGRNQAPTTGGSPCPTITLGILNFASGSQPTVGIAITGGALITGGQSAYTLDSVTGTPPPGLTPVVAEFGGDWFFVVVGTPTTFGIYTFTANILDANGCPGTKEFTVEIWAVASLSAPQNILAGQNTFNVPLPSGLPTTYGTGIELHSVNLSLTQISNLNLQDSWIQTTTDIFSGLSLFDSDLSGSNITNAVFRQDAASLIATGSAPYTGNWQPGSATGFDDFIGQDLTDGVDLVLNTILPEGQITLLQFIFKPIP